MNCRCMMNVFIESIINVFISEVEEQLIAGEQPDWVELPIELWELIFQ